MTGLQERIAALVYPEARREAPGGVVAVARGGAVEEFVPFGLANLEHTVPNARDTVFYVASVSKQFVAASVALLERDGALRADDPVATYVPEVAGLGDVRVRHLIHHTSGIRDKYSLAAVGQLPDSAISTDEATLSLLGRQRTLGFPPGTRFSYSNSNYFLLAQVVARCSGQSLREFTDERLFAPLGMSGTWFRPDPTEVIPVRASGYRVGADGAWQLAEYAWSSLGPGGLVTTVDSLARWGTVFSDGALDGLADILTTTRPLEAGRANPYAYGLQVSESGGVRVLQHAGGVPGFGAQMIQVPSESLTVICLANAASVGAARLASEVLDLVLGREATTAAPAVEGPPSTEPTVGCYVDADEASVVLVEVSPGGGHTLELLGQRVPLQPTSGSAFTAGSAGVTFDEEGLSLRMGEDLTRYRRHEPSASLEDLGDWAGQYRSEELGVTLTVTQNATQAHVGWPDQEPRAVGYLGDGLLRLSLQGAVVVVRVLRRDGQATGLRISTERAFGTVFARTPAPTGSWPT